MTPLVLSSHSKHALETHKHTPEEGRSQDVPLWCVPVAVCLCFNVLAVMKMNLSNSALEWMRWEKGPLFVSLQWNSTGCHRWGSSWGQRKGPQRCHPWGNMTCVPLAVSEGRRGVGEQCLEASPFSFPSPQGLGDAEITRITSLHTRGCVVHQVAEMGTVYAWDWECQNCSCINEKTENHFHAFIYCKTSYGIGYSLTFLKWEFHLNSL